MKQTLTFLPKTDMPLVSMYEASHVQVGKVLICKKHIRSAFHIPYTVPRLWITIRTHGGTDWHELKKHERSGEWMPIIEGQEYILTWSAGHWVEYLEDKWGIRPGTSLYFQIQIEDK